MQGSQAHDASLTRSASPRHSSVPRTVQLQYRLAGCARAVLRAACQAVWEAVGAGLAVCELLKACWISRKEFDECRWITMQEVGGIGQRADSLLYNFSCKHGANRREHSRS